MQSSSFLLILYLISIYGYSFSRGFWSWPSFLVLSFCYLIFAISFFVKKKFVFGISGFEQILPFIFLLNSLLFVLLFGAVYQVGGLALDLIKYVTPLVLLFSFIFLASLTTKGNLVKLSFFGLIVVAVVLKVMVLISSPSPRIDVFDMLADGPKYLFFGKNPYSELYTQRYVGVMPDYFTYFPLAFLIFAPADFLFSDPRVTYIVGDLICIFFLYKLVVLAKSKFKTTRYLIPLIFLYYPSGSFILEQSWLDGLLFTALVVFIYLEIHAKKFKKYSFLPLALFLGIKQSLLIFLPFFLFYKKVKKTIILKALVLIVFSVLPFVLWNFYDFYHDTIKFFLDYPPRYDSITVNSFFFYTFGQDIPKVFLYLIWGAVGLLMLVRAKKTWSGFLVSVTFFLFTFYFFNKLAFIHYYFLVSLLIFLAAILRYVEESK
ncbi:hypothetical protein HYU92_05530 [Candidatus Curtissbacteria bacterium]|nr:hypothetical protein [Candidatus Curtissbacteria bacterium]